jgi:hypothetical protein
MQLEFASDHRCAVSVSATAGEGAGLSRSATTQYTWSASVAKGNTLEVVITPAAPGPQMPMGATIAFDSNDRCTFNTSGDEPQILTRIQ